MAKKRKRVLMPRMKKSLRKQDRKRRHLIATLKQIIWSKKQ
jgi:hypothetical protein